MSGPQPVYHTKPGSGSYHSSSSPPPNIPYESYVDTNPIATPPVPHSPTQISQYPPAGYMNQMNTSPTPPPLQHPAPVAAYPNQTPQNVQVAYPSPPETYQAVQAPYHSPQNSYHSQQPSESAPPQSPQYFLPQQAQPPQGQVSYATPQYIAPPPQTMSPTGMHPTMQVAMSPTYQNGSPAPQMQTPQVSTKHLLAFFLPILTFHQLKVTRASGKILFHCHIRATAARALTCCRTCTCSRSRSRAQKCRETAQTQGGHGDQREPEREEHTCSGRWDARLERRYM